MLYSFVIDINDLEMNCFGGALTDEERAQNEASRQIDQQLRKEKVDYKSTHRLLLLGK